MSGFDMHRLQRAAAGAGAGLGAALARLQDFRPSRPGRVLVFASDGFALCGALASCNASSRFTLSPPCFSTAADFAAATGEVLAQLRRQGRRLPKSAVLLSASAVGAVLELPVDPRKPRPAPQMAELVRWDLEELAVQQNDLWTLGALLMGRGYLDAGRRQEAEAEGGHGAANAFAALVGREALEECLRLQELLAGGDGELLAGWAGQGEAEGEEGFLWTASGINAGLRDAWVRALARHGLFLRWIAPLCGAGLAALGTLPERWLLVELQQEQAVLCTGRAERIEALNFRPFARGCCDTAALLERIRAALPAGETSVYLSAPAAQAPELLATLERELAGPGVTIRQLETATNRGAASAALAGGGRKALGLPAPGLLPGIMAGKAGPSWWKRPALWPWFGIALLFVALCGYEGRIQAQVARTEKSLYALEGELVRKTELRRKTEANIAEVRRLKSDLAVRETRLQEAERLRKVLDEVILFRQDLVPGVLLAVREAISDDIVLDMIGESEDRTEFRIEGWALSDTEGQLFASKLNEKLETWAYRVRDIELVRGQGRLGLDGYNMKLWLVRKGSKADVKPRLREASRPATPDPQPQQNAGGRQNG